MDAREEAEAWAFAPERVPKHLVEPIRMAYDLRRQGEPWSKVMAAMDNFPDRTAHRWVNKVERMVASRMTQMEADGARCEHDLVGVLEVAERIGVSRKTVAMWRHRGKLPPPCRELSGAPVWDWPDVKDAAEALARAAGVVQREADSETEAETLRRLRLENAELREVVVDQARIIAEYREVCPVPALRLVP